MSWETRKHKKYFYQSHRVNGKRVRLYMGRGPAAQLAAAAEELDARARAAERAELQALDKEFAHIEQILDHHERLLQLLVAAHLILAGYYKHKGQWRKRRKKNP